MHRTHEHGGHHGRPHHQHHRGFGGWGADVAFGRRRRMRRGDVRAALLVLLDEEARNGYGLMQAIEERSDGAWRPSPGSVYPALAQLEDEGLVRPEDEGSGKRFGLTDAGRAYVVENRETLGEPWANLGDEGVDMRKLFGGLALAMRQIQATGTAEQAEQARTILLDARKALYRILAEDS